MLLQILWFPSLITCNFYLISGARFLFSLLGSTFNWPTLLVPIQSYLSVNERSTAQLFTSPALHLLAVTHTKLSSRVCRGGLWIPLWHFGIAADASNLMKARSICCSSTTEYYNTDTACLISRRNSLGLPSVTFREKQSRDEVMNGKQGMRVWGTEGEKASERRWQCSVSIWQTFGSDWWNVCHGGPHDRQEAHFLWPQLPEVFLSTS